MVAYPHSPGALAVPYRVIDTLGTYSIVDTPYVHLWSSYPLYITSFQTSRGNIVEKLFTRSILHERSTAVHPIVNFGIAPKLFFTM